MNTPESRQYATAIDSPGPRGADELALIAARFPGFAIWRSVTANGGRYVAQGLDLHVHPHTVVTDDPAELVAALSASRGARRTDEPRV